MHNDQYGFEIITPAFPNHDFFAGMLAGCKRLGYQVIYYPPEKTFYFYDYEVEAFCPTTEGKLRLLISNYLIRCVEDCRSNVHITDLVVTFRENVSLQKSIEKAKALLQASRVFFEGKEGQRRFVDGKYIEPYEEPSHRSFVKNAIVRKAKAKLTVGYAFAQYHRFCTQQKMTALTKREFKVLVAEVIHEMFHLKLRHDIVGEMGTETHGWAGVHCRVDMNPLSSLN